MWGASVCLSQLASVLDTPTEIGYRPAIHHILEVYTNVINQCGKRYTVHMCVHKIEFNPFKIIV